MKIHNVGKSDADYISVKYHKSWQLTPWLTCLWSNTYISGYVQ